MKKLALILYLLLFVQLLKTMDNSDLNHAELHGELAAAVFRGEIEAVRKFIGAGAPLNIIGDWTGTPLAIAASRGYEDICKLLLEHRADTNVIGVNGTTALMVAIERRSKPICKLLLDHNANPNEKNERWGTPLLAAIDHGTIGTCKLLIRYGAGKNNNAAVALILRHCIISIGTVGVVDGWEKRCTEKELEKLLKTCKEFIANGFEVNSRYGNGSTPLIVAAIHNQEDVCKLFVERQCALHKSVILGLMCLRKTCWPLYQVRCVLKPYLEDHTVQALLRVENEARHTAYDYLKLDWLRPKEAIGEDRLKPKETKGEKI